MSGETFIFSAKMSILFKSKISLLFSRCSLFTIDSKSFILSSMRFLLLSSASFKSYEHKSAQKITACTFSKVWNHFRLSVRWPPTSINLKEKFLNVKFISAITDVRILVRRISCSVGLYPGSPKRSIASK